MTKVYNVWLSVEEIDEENDDNGKDISVQKLHKFKRKEDAEEFFGYIGGVYNVLNN